MTHLLAGALDVSSAAAARSGADSPTAPATANTIAHPTTQRPRPATVGQIGKIAKIAKMTQPLEAPSHR